MIKYICIDVDGTLTNGNIYMGENGEIMKAFNIKDGYAISTILKDLNIIPIIVTKRSSKITFNRCKELGVTHIYQGVNNKIDILQGFQKDNNTSFEEFAYIGDDIPDLQCMKLCSFKACPKDAVNEIKKICDYVSNFNGGEGAVRDIIEHIKKSEF